MSYLCMRIICDLNMELFVFQSTHTVMIQWIPRIVQREDLRQHFQWAGYCVIVHTVL